MDQQLINDIKQSYFDYISKVTNGCKDIAFKIRSSNTAEAILYIEQFAEGLQWLLDVEKKFTEIGYTVKSRIHEASIYFNDINEALENKDYVMLADIFEYELPNVFDSASEWVIESKE
ncbi:hypothetical protein [Lysinibacillus sp. BPa_S21]|uniref:hypothetical protein n=1 Tax=Lysinibacillus sp. BPa_S21 TaxID=2932478 RepID=UPI00201222CF|nr:hypothetical protein [Lysinibacillus sp. BPa_S21]